MAVRLFVGNLPYGVSEPELRQFFAPVASPSHISIPVDRETGRPRGFAFVEFLDRGVAEQVIQRFNGQSLNGRMLSISEARAREDRGPGMRPSAPFVPRPPRPADDGGSGAGLPASDRPSRSFGPPAPTRKQKASAKGRQKTERGPKGPIRQRTTGRVFAVDDMDDEEADVALDDIATALPDDEQED